MRAARGADWVPPLLVGAAAGIAAETAVAVLLYTGTGLVRSLTTVLATEGAALAAGLGRALPAGPIEVDRQRRRWIFCLGSFIAAALFGTFWSVSGDFGNGPIGQGLGLAMLAALPLYGCGLVLAGMPSSLAADRPRRPGAAATLGAALGFVVTGLLLPRAPLPGSLLLGCVVLVSAAGMAYGAVLGVRPVVHVRAERVSSGSEVRVEDHVRSPGSEAVRYLLEGGYMRRREVLGGDGLPPWDVTVVRSMFGAPERPGRILLVGGGASPFVTEVVEGSSLVTVDVLERNAAVVELARSHFGGEASPEASNVTVRTGNLEDLLAEVRGPYDLVLVDTRALAPLGGGRALSRVGWERVLAAVGAEGVLASGPAPLQPDERAHEGSWHHATLRRPGADPHEVLVVSRPEQVGPWLQPLGDFVPSNGHPWEP